jgi:hypothetical protein
MNKLKICILGNMNNNGFALMRYLRDLNVDAELLLFANDGIGSLSHFKPSDDTFSIEQFSKHIRQTEIFDVPYHGFSYPIQHGITFVKSIYNLVNGRGVGGEFTPLSKTDIAGYFENYEHVIISGYAPIILDFAKVNVSIFFPYGNGVEGLYRYYAPPWRNFPHRILFEIGRYYQIRALRNVSNILVSDLEPSGCQLKSVGLDFQVVSVPMVYFQEDLPSRAGNFLIDHVHESLSKSRFTVMMHCRLVWTEKGCISSKSGSKNNHWLLQAFKSLSVQRPELNPKMIILEYGPDVYATKELIAHLGLSESIIWVPKTSRKYLMFLLSKVDVGVGEFVDVPRLAWGGTGWEVLASGKPLLQGFHFAEGEFESIYGYPPPPMLPVKSQEDILPHLLDMADHPEKREAMGQGAKAWFAEHNGIGLARKWLDILLSTGRQSV